MSSPKNSHQNEIQNETQKESAKPKRTTKQKLILAAKIIIPLAILVVILSLVGGVVTDFIVSQVDLVRESGFVGFLVFFIIYIGVTVLLIPASILTIIAGLIWGIVGGTLAVNVSATFGANAAFLLGKTFLHDWVEKKVNEEYPNFKYLDKAIEEQGFQINALIRLSPLIPFNFLNYAISTTSMKLWQNILGTSLGTLPGTVLYVFIGTTISDLSEERERNPLELVFFIVGFIFTLLLFIGLFKWAKGKLDKAVQAGQDAENASKVEEGKIKVEEVPVSNPNE